MRFRPEIDYYEILQVHPKASQEMVKKAYRTLMGEMGGHPDLGGNEEHAKLINEAYTVLADPELRWAYNRARAVHVPRGQPWAGEAGFPGAAGPSLDRVVEIGRKLALSAAVVAGAIVLARVLRSPTLDLADLLAMLFVLVRIWGQVSLPGRT
jgi:curved DNA-binding protein CbpA